MNLKKILESKGIRNALKENFDGLSSYEIAQRILSNAILDRENRGGTALDNVLIGNELGEIKDPELKKKVEADLELEIKQGNHKIGQNESKGSKSKPITELFEPAGDKILFVTYLSMDVTEDSFEEGEIGKGQTVLQERIGKEFKAFEELKKYMVENYSLPEDNENWGVGDEGRIDAQNMVDENNSPVDTNDRIYKEWKEGKAKLWAAYYVMSVEIIEKKSIPSAEELAKITGLQIQ